MDSPMEPTAVQDLPALAAATPVGPDVDALLNRHFAGKVVRKDLTKLIKEGANVPVYVLEYLLGSYCASNDKTVIEDLSLDQLVLAYLASRAASAPAR